MKRFTVNINGEVWTVVYRPPSRMPRSEGKPDWGACQWERRTILVNNSLSEMDTLLTLLHEHDHANHPNFGEPAVERIDDERRLLIEAAGLKITRMDA